MVMHTRGSVPASNQAAKKAGLGYTTIGERDAVGTSVRTLTRGKLQMSYPDLVIKTEKECEKLLKHLVISSGCYVLVFGER